MLTRYLLVPILASFPFAAELLAADPPVRTDLYGDPLPPGAVTRMGTTRFRHNDDVLSVAFSPDGKLVASGSEDRTVRFWDPATGKELRRLTGHTHKVSGVVFSADGKVLASASDDRTIRLWEVATGKELRTFSVRGRTTSQVLSRDGNLMAWGTDYGFVHVWELDGQKALHEFQAHSSGHGCLALSPDGKLLASGGADRLVKLWDVATGKEVRHLKGHREPITAIAFSPDGKLLASGGADRLVKLWDVAEGKELDRLPRHQQMDYVAALAFSPDGKTLVSGSMMHQTAVVWDLNGQAKPRTIWSKPPCGTGFRSISYSPDGKTVAVAHPDQVVRFWDIPTGKLLNAPTGNLAAVNNVALSPDGKTLASAGEDGTVRLWEMATGKELSCIQQHWSRVVALAYSPDGKRLAAVDHAGVCQIWDPMTSRSLRQISNAGIAHAATFSPDGKILLTGNWMTNTIDLFDPTKGKLLRQFTGPKGDGICCLTFSPNGKVLASSGGGHADGSIYLWDFATGRLLAQFKGHPMATSSLAFTPDGRMLASAGVENRGDPNYVRLWEVASGQERGRLGGARPGIEDYPTSLQSVAITPDGRLLCDADEEGVIRFWDLARGTECGKLKAYQGPVGPIKLSHDGKLLLVPGQDTTILVWDLDAVAPRLPVPPLKPLPENKRDADWEALGVDDAEMAYRIALQMRRTPPETIELLQKHLQPAKAVDGARVARLVAELVDDQEAVRTRARRELLTLDRLAEPGLRKALEKGAPAELRPHVQDILDQVTGPLTSQPTLRDLRAIEVLERIGTPEARKLLQTLADGAPESRVTQEAKASLQRIGNPK